MNYFRLLIALAVLFPFSGCVSEKESLLEQGYPPAYADGFGDGCSSGKKAGGNGFEQFRKDVRRFETDPQYAHGWTDGFTQCEKEQVALQRRMKISIEQQQLAEQRRQNALLERHHFEREMLRGVNTDMLKKLGGPPAHR